MTTSVLVGNPFGCAWLVNEGLESKNVRLGKNYIVSSKRDILKAEGIKCFEDGVNEQKLIVVESKMEQNGEVSEFNTQFQHLPFFYRKVESNQVNLQNQKMSEIQDDDFNYRSILLWLSFGCLGVFAALRLLKCFLNKSEKESEEYRRSLQQQPVSTHEEFKSLYDEKSQIEE